MSKRKWAERSPSCSALSQSLSARVLLAAVGVCTPVRSASEPPLLAGALGMLPGAALCMWDEMAAPPSRSGARIDGAVTDDTMEAAAPVKPALREEGTTGLALAGGKAKADNGASFAAVASTAAPATGGCGGGARLMLALLRKNELRCLFAGDATRFMCCSGRCAGSGIFSSGVWGGAATLLAIKCCEREASCCWSSVGGRWGNTSGGFCHLAKIPAIERSSSTGAAAIDAASTLQ